MHDLGQSGPPSTHSASKKTTAPIHRERSPLHGASICATPFSNTRTVSALSEGAPAAASSAAAARAEKTRAMKPA